MKRKLNNLKPHRAIVTVILGGIFGLMGQVKPAFAGVVWVGSSIGGPVVSYETDGTLLTGKRGSAAATAVAIDETQDAFTLEPGTSSSTVTEYGPGNQVLSSFVFTGGTDPNSLGFPNFISDIVYGGHATFWLAGTNGEIYHVNNTGSVLSAFDSGYTKTGVAFDGAAVYTTTGTSSGPGGNAGEIIKWNTSGVQLSVLDTFLTEAYGLGYDSAANSFWVGGSDVVTQVDTTGAVLSAIAVAGVHSGVDVEQLVVVPEPASAGLMLCALCFLIARFGLPSLRQSPGRFHPVTLAAALFTSSVAASAATPLVTGVVVSTAAPYQLGTPLTFTASATSDDQSPLWYRFSAGPHGGVLKIVSDYSPLNAFTWTTIDADGDYDIVVSAQNSVTKLTSPDCNIGQACWQTVTLSPLAVDAAPVITPTALAQVVIYSAVCPAGSSMRVRFRPLTPLYLPDNYEQIPPTQTCSGRAQNFYIAGMRANTPYTIRHDIFTGPFTLTGPVLTFTPVVALPGNISSHTISNLPLSPTSISSRVIFNSVLYKPQTATDLYGNVIWYFDPQDNAYTTRPIAGGGSFEVVIVPGADRTRQLVRAIDLAGNVTLRTNAATVSDQLAALGKPPINGFHHEARYLPNGDIVVLAGMEKIFSDGTQGSSPQNPLDIFGDVILVMNPNLQVIWYWSSFDHLDVTRQATLVERGASTPLYLAGSASDWTHGNSVSLTPDGNFLYSARHQDMVYKIAYDTVGDVIWKLGSGGDFALTPNDPTLWFSHQHDPEFDGPAGLISIFDDGNVRRNTDPGAHSRGQVYAVNEAARTVTLPLNSDLGGYSFALGSAQRLPNGHYWFDSGILGAGSQSFETTATGTVVYSQSALSEWAYRTFRMRDLYTP